MVVDSYRFAAAGGFTDPTDLAGLKMWYDFSDTATISDTGGLVDSVTDKSGNGYTLTGTTTTRPTTGATTQNSLNVLDFDGSTFVIASTTSDWIWMHDGVDDIAVFCAYKWTSGSNNTLLSTTRVLTTNRGFAMLLASSGTNLYHYTDASAAVVVNNRSAFSGRTTSANLAVIVADHAAAAADRSRLRANGSAVTGDNAQTNTPSGLAPYTALKVGKADNFGLAGSMFEVFGCVNPTTDEITAAETYLMDKWGIT